MPLHPSHLRWGCCMHYCGAPDAGGSQVQALVGLRFPHSLLVGTRFPAWGSYFHKTLTPRDACCVSRAAMCSAIITVVRCVLARGISGMTDASTTRSRST